MINNLLLISIFSTWISFSFLLWFNLLVKSFANNVRLCWNLQMQDHVAILSPLSDLPRGVIPGAAVRHLHFDQLPVLHCGNSFTISSISSVLVKLFTNFKLNFCTLEACQCLCEKLNYKEKLKNKVRSPIQHFNIKR